MLRRPGPVFVVQVADHGNVEVDANDRVARGLRINLEVAQLAAN